MKHANINTRTVEVEDAYTITNEISISPKSQTNLFSGNLFSGFISKAKYQKNIQSFNR